MGWRGERVHVLDQCPDFPCKTTGPTSPSSASLWQRYCMWRDRRQAEKKLKKPEKTKFKRDERVSEDRKVKAL